VALEDPDGRTQGFLTCRRVSEGGWEGEMTIRDAVYQVTVRRNAPSDAVPDIADFAIRPARWVLDHVPGSKAVSQAVSQWTITLKATDSRAPKVVVLESAVIRNLQTPGWRWLNPGPVVEDLESMPVGRG
jgi:hypothetical protein